MMRCLGPSNAKYVLAEIKIHEGINSHHMGGKALAKKALRAGYYWPTMMVDSKEAVKRCDSCQKHAKIIWPPPMELKGPRQFRWLIVAVDYFTKWIEAEPLTTITSARIRRFFRHNIVSRFGIPAKVVTDNGTQFMDKRFQDMMSDLDVRQHFASVEHPQSNGQAEAANKIVLDCLKKWMQDAESN
ncbi:hypothetical protein QN277_000879 [Acacia crassicarpa]|uniref:Integrase catalytic domain-containing protein n=1 Tax=Acacia crassicarpa TaxID=499986 RepID=A0AAE1THP0_9FABA|nr:hypothetical protein QN277_000879 [Acacia crassicarpa]